MASSRVSLGSISDLAASTLFTASGSLAVGDVVYLVTGSNSTVAKADVSTGKIPPIGIVAAVNSTAQVTVALNHEIAGGFSSLSRGQTYWLAATPGTVTSTKPASDAYVVGVAVSESEILVLSAATSLDFSGSSGSVTSVTIASPNNSVSITNPTVTTSGTVSLALNTLPISSGGTGQTTKAAACLALSPLTTKGDILTHDGTNNVRLPVGADGSYLVVNSSTASGLGWATPTGTITSLSLTSGDSITLATSGYQNTGELTYTANIASTGVSAAEGGTGQWTGFSTPGSSVLMDPLSSLSQTRKTQWTYRNRIINGDMSIRQRGTANVTTTASYPVDRWLLTASSGPTSFTSNQYSTSTNLPRGLQAYPGVNNALLYTNSTAYTTGVGTLVRISQAIEYANMRDFGFGTNVTNRRAVVSFWVRTSLAGTYAVAFQNNGATRSYVTTYTTTANTWTYVVKNIPIDSDNSWITTSSNTGLRVIFDFGSGTTYSAPATDAWQAGNYSRGTTQTALNTASANVYLTAVQVELMDGEDWSGVAIATPFELIPRQKQFENCLRYSYIIGGLIGTNAGGNGYVSASNAAICNVSFPVPMRSSPTVSTTPSHYRFLAGTGTTTTPTTVTAATTPTAARMTFSVTSNTWTPGAGALFYTNTAGTNALNFNAEIT